VTPPDAATPDADPGPRSLGALLLVTAGRLGAAGVDEARLAAELLLREATGLDRAAFIRDLRMPAPSGVVDRLEPLVRRAQAGEPVAYILSRREF
jgi:release factor glutamine methyltransferase